VSQSAEGKRVTTRYEVLPVMLDRWSPRSFSEREPEPEKLRSVFEAARLAPSAHNTQPPRFILTRRGRGDAHERLSKCLSDANQTWAPKAPVLVLASAMRERFSQVELTMVPYPHAMHDLGLAVMSFILQAQSLGLGTHPMAGFDPELASAALSVPSDYEPAIVIALGYRGSPDALPEDLRRREVGPRTRRALEDVVFEDEWGSPCTLFADEVPE
jgi:nitroreductase